MLDIVLIKEQFKFLNIFIKFQGAIEPLNQY